MYVFDGVEAMQKQGTVGECFAHAVSSLGNQVFMFR